MLYFSRIFGLVVRNFALALHRFLLVIENEYHVVVTRGHNLVLVTDHLQTPHFALEVRLHQHLLRGVFLSQRILELNNASIAKTN